MNAKNIQMERLRLAGICGMLLMATACSDEMMQHSPGQEELPVKILAEIDSPLSESSIASDANTDPANRYDRSSFLTGDKIRVKRNINTMEESVGYVLSDGGQWSPQGTGLTLRIKATYQASFPFEYKGINPNQAAEANFLASNFMQTKPITSSTGVIDFTGDNALVHQNTKITLTFTGATDGGKLNGSFTNFAVKGPGLCTNTESEETMYFLRPSHEASSWCGIVRPKAASTTITLSLTYDNVGYTTTITCLMEAGKHYKYSLTLKNDILVPDGMVIEGWRDADNPYTGDFDILPTDN